MDILKAINFATLKHINQKRKCSDLPYIVHPMEVMYILLSQNCESDVVIAGILHDTLEDTATTQEELTQNFGEHITRLVLSNSEDKSKTWKERKQATIDEIKNLNQKEMQLLLADKLSNLNTMYNDLHIIGDTLWDRFNANKEQVLWYYKSIIDELNKYMQDKNFVQKLENTYNNIVSFT